MLQIENLKDQVGELDSKQLTHVHVRTTCIQFSVLYLTFQESRKLVEDALLGVKGVISFTFNMPQKRCILRVRTDMKPEVPCRALEATGELTVKHVIKNENGEEVSSHSHTHLDMVSMLIIAFTCRCFYPMAHHQKQLPKMRKRIQNQLR